MRHGMWLYGTSALVLASVAQSGATQRHEPYRRRPPRTHREWDRRNDDRLIDRGSTTIQPSEGHRDTGLSLAATATFSFRTEMPNAGHRNGFFDPTIMTRRNVLRLDAFEKLISFLIFDPTGNVLAVSWPASLREGRSSRDRQGTISAFMLSETWRRAWVTR